jgi:hypothetical protein
MPCLILLVLSLSAARARAAAPSESALPSLDPAAATSGPVVPVLEPPSVPAGAAAAAPGAGLQPDDAFDPSVDRPRLGLGAARGATIATGIVALAVASEIERSNDVVIGCRWCEPGALDRWARDRLRWSNTWDAGDASDVLLLAVPLGTAAAAISLGLADGSPREVIEDVLVIAASLVVADSLTTGLKHGRRACARNAWAAGGPSVEGDMRSFVSAHTSRVSPPRRRRR